MYNFQMENGERSKLSQPEVCETEQERAQRVIKLLKNTRLMGDLGFSDTILEAKNLKNTDNHKKLEEAKS